MPDSAGLCLACDACGARSSNVRRCGGCGGALYCGRECQRADWPDHRPLCQQLAAARGAALRKSAKRGVVLSSRPAWLLDPIVWYCGSLMCGVPHPRGLMIWGVDACLCDGTHPDCRSRAEPAPVFVKTKDGYFTTTFPDKGDARASPSRRIYEIGRSGAYSVSEWVNAYGFVPPSVAAEARRRGIPPGWLYAGVAGCASASWIAAGGPAAADVAGGPAAADVAGGGRYCTPASIADMLDQYQGAVQDSWAGMSTAARALFAYCPPESGVVHGHVVFVVPVSGRRKVKIERPLLSSVRGVERLMSRARGPDAAAAIAAAVLEDRLSRAVPLCPERVAAQARSCPVITDVAVAQKVFKLLNLLPRRLLETSAGGAPRG